MQPDLRFIKYGFDKRHPVKLDWPTNGSATDWISFSIPHIQDGTVKVGQVVARVTRQEALRNCVN